MAFSWGEQHDLHTMLMGFVPAKATPPPRPNSYEQRIECFKKLLENQKSMASLSQQSAPRQEQFSFYQKEYRDLYAKCESVMKP